MMMANPCEEDKMEKKDDQVPAQLPTILVNDGQLNDRQAIMRNDSDVHSDRSQMSNLLSAEDSGCTSVDSMARNPRIVEVNAEGLSFPVMPSINDIKAELTPIVEYAKEPLLPLYKACIPLIDILHNLYIYVQIALNETPEVPLDELTVDESAAIRLYTMEWDAPYPSLYVMLNQAMRHRNREHIRPYFKYMKLFLTALVKLPCVPQSTVWRAVTKNVSADFPPNTAITSWAFLSCTSVLPALENNDFFGSTDERTLFSVEAINGREIRGHSYFSTEDEIVLLPGTHMIVQSQFSPTLYLHIIHLKQIILDQVLLEPPFEGMLNVTNVGARSKWRKLKSKHPYNGS